jgi:5,10-methylenetetrahydrofolate reductase
MSSYWTSEQRGWCLAHERTAGTITRAHTRTLTVLPQPAHRCRARRRSPSRRVGIHWATEQCRKLLDNQVRGIHFYTLNKSDATRQIYENLGVKDSAELRHVG